jgi:hypothetical protein
MGIDESRPFIMSFTFMVVYILLLSQIPVELYVHSYTQHDYNIPPYFEGLDVGVYSLSHNFTINDATTTQILGITIYDWSLGGFDWRLLTDVNYNYMMIGKRNMFGIFLISTDYLDFIGESGNNRDTELYRREMNLDYTGDESWVHYRMSLEAQPEVGCDIYLGFNTTLYNSPGEALENQALTVFQTMGLDDVYTSFNVWRLIGQLMFMTLPDIHPVLNVVLIAPIWANIVWTLLIVLSKLIPGLG